MKKINILIFIMLIFAFILTGCSGSKASGVTEGAKVNKEDLKIGFVHYSDQVTRDTHIRMIVQHGKWQQH